MSHESGPLHCFIFPLMAPGHFIPALDLAQLLALRGAVVTLITTSPAPSANHPRISVHLLSAAGLREPPVRPDSEATAEDALAFIESLAILQPHLEHLLRSLRPDCLVSDVFLPWTATAASKFGVPRLVFSGSGFFPLCVSHSLTRHSPHARAGSFHVPGLPHQIELTRAQLPAYELGLGPFARQFQRMREARAHTHGEIINSFYELEPDYVGHYKKEIGGKAWHVGPVSLCNGNRDPDQSGGNEASVDPGRCAEWLDSRPPGSAVYVCFGSMGQFSVAQMAEIAWALEGSGRPFVWAFKDTPGEGWIPDGFEERTRQRGLIIRGWAPQRVILGHRAVGGFVTHCGWNSVLEAVCAGVPMATWPLYAEQFYNEKLVTRVLGIGVEVGIAAWSTSWRDCDETMMVGRKKIASAVAQLMDGGDEGDGMRRRAKELSQMARLATEEGGSSYLDLTRFMEDIRSHGHK